MAITAAIHHVTHYKYARPITLGPQTIRLRPAAHCRTPIESYSLKVTPGGHFLNWLQDPHGNFLARVVFPEPVSEFGVEVDVLARMDVFNPFDFFLEDHAEEFPFSYGEELAKELKPYLGDPVGGGPLFENFMATVDRTPRRMMDFLVELNMKVNMGVGYLVRLEPGVQTPEQTFQIGTGSCRDSAWLLVNAARALGLAARFVSGYLIQLTPDVKSVDGPSGTEVDFTDLHAWAEIYLPGAGWVGLDATSGLLTGEGHLPLAATPAPGTAAPISGALEQVETEFHFEMDVSRKTRHHGSRCLSTTSPGHGSMPWGTRSINSS